MQEDIEQRTMSVTVQAAKLSGRVLKAAIAAALQKMPPISRPGLI